MRIYVLGAGASEPDGMPLTGEIIDKAFWNFGGKSNTSDMHLVGVWEKEEGEYFLPVFKLYDYFYKTNLVGKFNDLYNDMTHPLGLSTNNIEDFFTRLDRLKRGAEKYGLDLSKDEIEELWSKGRYLFFHTLCHEAIDGRFPYYQAFVSNVLQQNGQHCIISFNYDLLLEEVLTQHLTLANGRWTFPDNLCWTYGMPLRYGHSEPYQFPSNEDMAKIIYFKLHGSFNMGYCPITKEVTTHCLSTRPFIYKHFHEGKERCHNGSHASLPLLIPPLNQKEIVVPALQESWNKAYAYLKQCTELHIIGYSMPSVDAEAMRLLQYVPKSQLQEVIIANPNNNDVHRLVTVIGLPKNKIRVVPGFKEYLQGFGANLN